MSSFYRLEQRDSDDDFIEKPPFHRGNNSPVNTPPGSPGGKVDPFTDSEVCSL